MRLSSVTGVLHNASGEGKCYAAWCRRKQISSYFRALIAVFQNNLLLSGSRGSVTGAGPMSDFSHEPERISRLEAWSLALAPALVALIAIDIVPHMHCERQHSMTTATWTGRAPKELKRADNV